LGKIERFEGIKAWRMAKDLVMTVYQITGKGKFVHDFGLRDQIRRAAISAMSNIAEGFERGSNAEFCRFLRIAKGSCGEVRSQLYVAQELEYVDRQEFISSKTQAEELSRALSGFISYLVRANPK